MRRTGMEVLRFCL